MNLENLKVGDVLAIPPRNGSAPVERVVRVARVTTTLVEDENGSKWRRDDGCQIPRQTGKWAFQVHARPCEASDLAYLKRAQARHLLVNDTYAGYTDEEIDRLAAVHTEIRRARDFRISAAKGGA